MRSFLRAIRSVAQSPLGRFALDATGLGGTVNGILNAVSAVESKWVAEGKERGGQDKLIASSEVFASDMARINAILGVAGKRMEYSEELYRAAASAQVAALNAAAALQDSMRIVDIK